MGDAEKVLRLLKRKDEQAQQNIGDPAVFLGVYDAAGEEDVISQAFESGAVEELERRMEANAAPYLQQSSGDSLFEELFGDLAGDRLGEWRRQRWRRQRWPSQWQRRQLHHKQHHNQRQCSL